MRSFVRRDVAYTRKCPLENLLDDPYCLAPPELGVGEFHADTDEASIEEAFRKYAGAGSKVMQGKEGELAGGGGR